jgi:hypothetical protein
MIWWARALEFELADQIILLGMNPLCFCALVYVERSSH